MERLDWPSQEKIPTSNAKLYLDYTGRPQPSVDDIEGLCGKPPYDEEDEDELVDIGDAPASTDRSDAPTSDKQDKKVAEQQELQKPAAETAKAEGAASGAAVAAEGA